MRLSDLNPRRLTRWMSRHPLGNSIAQILLLIICAEMNVFNHNDKGILMLMMPSMMLAAFMCGVMAANQPVQDALRELLKSLDNIRKLEKTLFYQSLGVKEPR